MSKPLEFFIGQWDPRGAPLEANEIIHVAVTKDNRWPSSFQVIEKTPHVSKCVSMHEELLEALKLALKIGVTRICSSEEAEQIESAIAKAEAP